MKQLKRNLFSSNRVRHSLSHAILLFFLLLLSTQPLSSQHPTDRNLLHKALSGDFETTTHLLNRWKKSVTLPRAVEIDNHPPSILPQTYLSANILLALIPPEKIVAIPEGLRSLTQFHPKSTLNKVSLDTNRFNSEKIYLKKPEVALIASYSLPSTVQALKNQGIKTVTIDQINSPEEIIENIQQIGSIAKAEEKAQLLALLVEALFEKIDQRKSLHTPPQRVLYLSYYNQFTTPTRHSLTGKMLNRLGIQTADQLLNLNLPTSEWALNLTGEQLYLLKPETIVITSPDGKDQHPFLSTHPITRHLSPVKAGKVITIDSATQSSLSQYIALAYYDLFYALYGELPPL